MHSFWGLSKNRDVVDETYVVKLIAVVGVLPAVILVLADLQTMTDPLILPSRRAHPQQSVDKDVENLRGRDTSLRYTCIKRDCCTFCVVWQDDSSQDADHGYQFNNIGFVDNISIFAETPEGMQTLLDVVQEFTTWRGTEINVNKEYSCS